MSAGKRIRVRDADRVVHAAHGKGTVVGDNVYDQNTYNIALIRFDSGKTAFVSTYDLRRLKRV